MTAWKRTSGWSVRLPAKLALASVMVLPSWDCLAGRSALPLEPGGWWTPWHANRPPGASDGANEVGPTSRYDRPKRRYQRTASTMTSGGKRKPAKADRRTGADEGGEFSYRQSRCLDTVVADATVPPAMQERMLTLTVPRTRRRPVRRGLPRLPGRPAGSGTMRRLAAA